MSSSETPAWSVGQQCAVIEAVPETDLPVPGACATVNAEVAALDGDKVDVRCPDIQRELMRFYTTGWQPPFTDPKWRLVPAATVTIPAMQAHDGMHSIRVTLRWTCPRGEVFDTISWDGSRRLGCRGWKNSCGHVDGYSDVRREAEALKRGGWE